MDKMNRSKTGRRIFSLAAVLLLSGVIVLNAYAHTAPITLGGENRYKAVRLTPEIYNAAGADLSDLLINDASGGHVPYFINSYVINEQETRQTYEMTLIDSYLKDDSFYFDYKLAAERTSDTVADAIEFASDQESFMKEVELWGSYDGVNWTYLQNDKLYAVDDVAKLQITLNEPQKYTHYRLKLSNNLEQIAFHSVKLISSTDTADETYFIESLSPAYKVEEKENNTVISIEGLTHLRLCDVTIHTDSMFKRTAYADSVSPHKELYHLSFDELSYEDTTIPLHRHIPYGETYTVSIANGDDKPIDITGVTVRYYADEIVFEANAGEAYTLEFDSNANRAKPEYDIARYKEEILKGEIDRLTLGAVQYIPTGEPQQMDQKLIFNIVVVAVAVLLGAVILLKLKQK